MPIRDWGFSLRGNQAVVQVLGRCAVSLCTFCAVDSAHGAADATDTLQPYILESLGFDDNLFRLPKNVNPVSVGADAPERWDWTNQVAAGLKTYHPIGRQELSFNGNVGYQSFANHSTLNNLNADLNGLWKWRVGNQWNGLMSYGYKRYLGGFTNTGFFGKDELSNNSLLLEGNYLAHPKWRVNAQYRLFDSQHSASQRKFLDTTTNSGVVGLHYQSTVENSLGLQFRYTEGFLPNREPNAFTLVDNSYYEEEILVPVTWRPTGKSYLQADIGWLMRNQKQFSQRNFQGETWHLNYQWLPTGLTQLGLSTWRELRSALDLTASYFVAEGVSLNPSWSISPKITLQGKAAWEQWTYSGNPDIVAGLQTRKDTIWYAQFGATYDLLQSLNLNLSYQYTERTSNRTLFNYNDNMVVGTAMFRF